MNTKVMLFIALFIGITLGWCLSTATVNADATEIVCVVEELRPVSYILFEPGVGYVVGEPEDAENPGAYVDAITPYWGWPDEIPADPDVFPELRYAIIRDGVVIADLNGDLVAAVFYYNGSE